MLVTALKFAFAALLLAFVLLSLPWRDQAMVADAAGKRAFAGTIVGDWRSGEVRFRFDASVPRETLPARWQAEVERSGTALLTRGGGTGWAPSMPRVFGSVDLSRLAAASLLLFTGVLLQTTRWWRLLAAVGCPTRWTGALRLNLYGLFFSLVVPGQTGGDVVRAVMVAREHPGRGAAASISVLIDRVLSLLVLGLLGAVAIVLEGERFAPVRGVVLGALCVGIAGAAAYASPALRRALGFRGWLEVAPMSKSLLQIDDAFLVYAQRPLELALAAAISLANHLCVAFAIVALGRSFGDSALSLLQYIAVSSVGNIVSALPVTPGGWGVGEAAYQYLFALVGGDGTIGVAVSITFKLVFGLIGLCGGAFLLLSGGQRQLAELRRAQAGR